MKKPTRDEAIAAKDMAERELWLWIKIYHDLRAGRAPDAVHAFFETDARGKEVPGYHYRMELWRTLGAEGGILVIIFSAPRQSDTINVFGFEDYALRIQDQGQTALEFRIGVERLMDARRRLYDLIAKAPSRADILQRKERRLGALKADADALERADCKAADYRDQVRLSALDGSADALGHIAEIGWDEQKEEAHVR